MRRQQESTDNGAEIASEPLATIFDPFVRDARASAVNEQGLGIGVLASGISV